MCSGGRRQRASCGVVLRGRSRAGGRGPSLGADGARNAQSCGHVAHAQINVIFIFQIIYNVTNYNTCNLNLIVFHTHSLTMFSMLVTLSLPMKVTFKIEFDFPRLAPDKRIHKVCIKLIL